LGANPYLETGAGKNVFQLATEASHAKVLKLLNAAVEADSNRFARLKKKARRCKSRKRGKEWKTSISRQSFRYLAK